MGQPFSILSLPYLTFVCYPVAKSNNPTQGFSVMQVLTLLLANLDYTQKQYFRYIARQNKPLFDVIFSHKRERIIISPSHRVRQARPYPPFFLQKHYGQNFYLYICCIFVEQDQSQRLGGYVCQGALLVSTMVNSKFESKQLDLTFPRWEGIRKENLSRYLQQQILGSSKNCSFNNKIVKYIRFNNNNNKPL